MTVTLVVPVAAGLIGPGSKIGVENDDIGPIPLDDYISVILQRPSTFEVALYTILRAEGLHTVYGVLGVWAGVPWNAGVEGNNAQLAQGDPVLVNINWQHAGGAFVASVAVSGSWTYDAVGGLGAMMAKLHQGSAGGGGSLDDILAAVQRVYP